MINKKIKGVDYVIAPKTIEGEFTQGKLYPIAIVSQHKDPRTQKENYFFVTINDTEEYRSCMFYNCEVMQTDWKLARTPYTSIFIESLTDKPRYCIIMTIIQLLSIFFCAATFDGSLVALFLYLFTLAWTILYVYCFFRILNKQPFFQ